MTHGQKDIKKNFIIFLFLVL